MVHAPMKEKRTSSAAHVLAGISLRIPWDESFFSFMLAFSSVPEKNRLSVAKAWTSFSAHVRVIPALRGTFGMSTQQVGFFATHDERGAKVPPIDEILLARYHTPEEHQRIARAVRLSYEFELLLYEMVMTIPPSESD